MRDLFSGTSSAWELDAEGTHPTEQMAMIHFKSLHGLELDYYGADAGDHTFKVDDVVFKVLEDPDDGYRSHLGTIDYTEEHNSIFFRTPVARVRIETYDSGSDSDDPDPWDRRDEDDFDYGVNQGYRLIDVEDGHVWLFFGTHNYDDYYPCFTFRHQPKASPLKAAIDEARGSAERALRCQ